MSDTTSPGLLAAAAAAFRDHGVTAAMTALIGGFIALFAAVTRRAFTNEALLQRLDRELIADRERIDSQRVEDRKLDADRLDRIETDIRAVRDLLFEAFQRNRSG
ncbi:MAG: hypothetical protein JJ897_10200 [Marinibacterium sp.]|nr:hypothetical protein [Marinibacterium sp.]